MITLVVLAIAQFPLPTSHSMDAYTRIHIEKMTQAAATVPQTDERSRGIYMGDSIDDVAKSLNVVVDDYYKRGLIERITKNVPLVKVAEKSPAKYKSPAPIQKSWYNMTYKGYVVPMYGYWTNGQFVYDVGEQSQGFHAINSPRLFYYGSSCSTGNCP